MTEQDVPYGNRKALDDQIPGSSYFSFFKAPVNEPHKKPFNNITIKQIFDIIRGEQYAVRSKELNSLPVSEQQKYKQTKLDFVTYSGVFEYRAINGLTNRSQYFCVDIDHVGNIEKLNELKSRILENFTPALMNISPRKEGLKVVLCIVPDDGTHQEFYQTIENYFNHVILCGFKDTNGADLIIDKSCKDVCRAAYIACDPECFYSDNPTIFDKTYIDTFLSYKPADIFKEVSSIPDAMASALKMIREAPDGQKHLTLLKASRLVGGLITGGQVEEVEAVKLLEQEISKREIQSFSQAQNTILAGIKNGKEAPITTNQEKATKNDIKVPPFPVKGLPQDLQDLINTYSDVYGTPRDFWAAAFLLATSLGIGQSVKLRTKYVNAPCLWFTFIAPTSIGKTEPLDVALSPFFQIDRKNYNEFKNYEKEYEQWKDTQKKDRMIDYMDTPVCKQYTLQDFTPEALYQVHSENLRGVVIYRDELTAWIKDFNRYNKSGEQENYLSLFMGKPFVVNRKSQPLRINHPFVDVVGGLQPSVIPLMAKDNRDQIGFLARFGNVFPDNVEKPLYIDKTLPLGTFDKYSRYINNLLQLDYNPDDPQYITLSPEADLMYQAWYNDNVLRTNKEKSDYLKGMFGKLDIISLRLALTIHFSKWAFTSVQEEQVSTESMQAALDITEYFRITGLKVYNYLVQGDTYTLTKKNVAHFLTDLGNSQSEIARVLKCTQQNIQQLLKK